jgi:hypothetical protein
MKSILKSYETHMKTVWKVYTSGIPPAYLRNTSGMGEVCKPYENHITAI